MFPCLAKLLSAIDILIGSTHGTSNEILQTFTDIDNILNNETKYKKNAIYLTGGGRWSLSYRRMRTSHSWVGFLQGFILSNIKQAPITPGSSKLDSMMANNLVRLESKHNVHSCQDMILIMEEVFLQGQIDDQWWSLKLSAYVSIRGLGMRWWRVTLNLQN